MTSFFNFNVQIRWAISSELKIDRDFLFEEVFWSSKKLTIESDHDGWGFPHFSFVQVQTRWLSPMSESIRKNFNRRRASHPWSAFIISWSSVEPVWNFATSFWFSVLMVQCWCSVESFCHCPRRNSNRENFVWHDIRIADDNSQCSMISWVLFALNLHSAR